MGEGDVSGRIGRSGKRDADNFCLHNPHYDFNDDILPIGASYWVELTRELLPATS